METVVARKQKDVRHSAKVTRGRPAGRDSGDRRGKRPGARAAASTPPTDARRLRRVVPDSGAAGRRGPDLARRLGSILEEIGRTLERVSAKEVDRLARAILKARRVYVAGAGRSGLVSSCFAMRLVHLGLVAHVVGEATAPGLGRGDLLLVSSGSGRTRTILAQAGAATARGARVAAITADVRSPAAAGADLVVEIPAPPYAGKARLSAAAQAGARADDLRTAQPGGSLFEQSLLVLLDGLVLDLADRLGLSSVTLKERHSNLE